MREETGERGSGMFPDPFPKNFRFSLIFVAQTKESIKIHPEPSSQIPKRPTYQPKKTQKSNLAKI